MNAPSLIKTPYEKTKFKTQKELDDFLKCCDPETGYLYFMDNFFYIQHPAKGSMLYHPWPYQQRLIEIYHKYRYSIALMPRQSGKCFGINTIVTIRNSKTKKIEEVTIGEFYDRISKIKVYEQGTSPSAVANEENYFTRFFSWLNKNEFSEGIRTRENYIKRWLSTTADKRRGVCTNSSIEFGRIPDLSEKVERKFINSYQLTDYEVLTDTGWEKITDLHLTVPYDVYTVETNFGLKLECADTHILFDQNMNQVFVKDLSIGSLIHTKNGIESIKYIEKTNVKENMYDIGVDSPNHRFYSNGILSHNSTSAAGYLLWYAMFKPDSTILIAAHKYSGAQEIMQRIRYAYEGCPNYIKAGVTTYNKGSLDFENGSRIVSATTTENTGRGMSVSLLYCLDGDTTFVKIRHKQTLVEEEISLKNLYIRLVNPEKVIT